MWTVTSSNKSVVANATVPGVVHIDLLHAGIISEPYNGYNELLLRWVALDNWTFTRTFTATQQMLQGTSYLQFDGTSCEIDSLFGVACPALMNHILGLDTIATVTLNGRFIGNSTNAFVRWEAPLPSAVLKPGIDENTISVSFQCAQCVGQTLAAQYPIPLREFKANRKVPPHLGFSSPSFLCIDHSNPQIFVWGSTFCSKESNPFWLELGPGLHHARHISRGAHRNLDTEQEQCPH